jgi:hypothetical protein
MLAIEAFEVNSVDMALTNVIIKTVISFFSLITCLKNSPIVTERPEF